MNSIPAGAVVGLSVSSLFGVLLFLPTVVSILRVRVGLSFSSDALDWLLAPIAILATFAGGMLFAVLVDRARRSPLSWRRSAGIGLSLLLTCVVGSFAALAVEPIGVAQAPLLVFRIAFTLASGLVAFACTAIAARVFGLATWLAPALLVACVAAGTFLLVAFAVDPIPGWHVGGGDRAMLKVAALGNLVAGWIGGMAAFTVLVAAPRRRPVLAT